ncbi:MULTISPECIES: DUF4424 family protein [unclassified Aureimonas]|uniref:DUF4424 family protein n=1 Tax=unclassified Aureimonas TaxID=2615206 RepID=UPI000A8B9539|nr:MULTISPECIES: DUF4424 family protein [unclassified Aureimonas]
MPPIRPASALLAILALAAASLPASANDSAAEKAAGGLVLTKSHSVTMESEDLVISPTAIDITYVFRNTTKTDETLTVAFPLPPIEGYGVSMEPIDLAEPEAQNFVGFTVEANGRSIEPEIDEHAFLGTRDVTALLEENGLPLNPVVSRLGAAIANLSPKVHARLEAEGLLTERDLGEALWRYEVRFHFDQLFPAGEPVTIRHAYKPVAGSSFLTKSSFAEPGFTTLHCIDLGTRKAMEAVLRKAGKDALDGDPVGNSPLKGDPLGGLAYLRTVSYILTTANNWSGPIGRFRLVIDKGAPGNVVSLCQDGIRKTGPTRFEFEARNYTPKRDLHILFASPDAAGFFAE